MRGKTILPAEPKGTFIVVYRTIHGTVAETRYNNATAGTLLKRIQHKADFDKILKIVPVKSNVPTN